MSTSVIEFQNEKNCQAYESLVATGEPIVRNRSDGFVLMEHIPWEKMRVLVEEYCTLHDSTIREMFLSPSKDSARANALTRVENNASVEMMENLKAPYAFCISSLDRRTSPPRTAYAFARAKPIVNAMIQDGIDARRDSFHEVRNLDLETQQRIAGLMLSDANIRYMSWSRPSAHFDRVASERIRELAEESSSTHAFLEIVLGPILEWINCSHHRNRRGNKAKRFREPTRPLCLSWFAIWLAERGKILFPVGVFNRVNELIPIFWLPFRRALVSEDMRDYWMTFENQLGALASPRKLAEGDAASRGRTDALDGARSTLSFLRWTSSWRGGKQVSADFLVEVFDAKSKINGTGARAEESTIQTRRIPHNVRAIWDLSKLDLKSISPGRLRDEDAKLRPQKIRTRVGGEAGRHWPWVDDPNYKRYRLGERYSKEGFFAGPNILAHVSEMRALLPKLVGKRISPWTHTLAIWLLYLSTLTDDDVPRSLLGVERSVHIDSPGNEKPTLCRFMKSQSFPVNIENRVFYYLEKLWKAAYELLPNNRRPSLLACPVLTRFDAPRLVNINKGQTHRRPLDEEILLLLISENRRDDFAFSRKREVGPQKRLSDYMRVLDPMTGEKGYQWFPGFAVLMDVLLSIPLRRHQARYLDSGEGDEVVLDIDSLETQPNLLGSKTIGRRECFFRRYETSLIESKPVLGMFVNTNKTGRPYDVPWLPADLARNVKRVIDWQIRFNPIEKPVPNHDNNSTYRGGFDDGARTWPIFRDPSDPSNEPISDNRLQNYFCDLFEHCERTYNSRGGRQINLFVDESQKLIPGKRAPRRKPIIDLHSLRVTGITILIENGVPLEVVRLLVGHATIAMTCYYHVLESRKVHEELMRAMESRVPTLEKLQAMTESQYKDWSTKFAFNRSKDPDLALGMIATSLQNRTPGWDMKYHGICAGGDCRYGGAPDKNEGPPTPLWRSEACSLCRYRVTGAPWLVGLVHHVNELWWELRECSKRVVELQLKRDEAEDAGQSIGSIGGELERAKIRRDHLMEEWVNELQYVEKAKRDLDDWNEWLDSEEGSNGAERDKLPVLRSPLGEEGVKVQLTTVHELSHLTELLRGVRIMPSAILPRGVKEDRNALLLDIARAAGIDMPFLRIPRADAERALDAFADLILDSFSEIDALEDLASGRASLNDFPSLRDRIHSLLPAPERNGSDMHVDNYQVDTNGKCISSDT